MIASSTLTGSLHTLRTQLGKGAVSEESRVVRPSDAAEVATALRIANDIGAPLFPFSDSAEREQEGILLDLSRLDQIERYDPGDLTIRVQAGVPVTQLLNRLAECRQMLPLDVPDVDRATVGSVLGRAEHGPMSASFGGVREYCIGIEFATVDGHLAHAGGMVVKNVAGYDLMKLLIGSYSTLAVITGATFKVFPLTQQTTTFVAEFASSDAAAGFCAAVRKSVLNPLCLELLSPNGPRKADTWQVLIRAAGSERVIGRYRRELQALVPEIHETEGREELELWRNVAQKSAGVPRARPGTMVLQVMTLIRESAHACNVLQALSGRYGFALLLQGRPGTGELIAILSPEKPSASYRELIDDLRKDLPPQSSVTVREVPAELHRENGPRIDLWGATRTDKRAMEIVKRTLDPKNILNPGGFLL